jgi:zinc protease
MARLWWMATVGGVMMAGVAGAQSDGHPDRPTPGATPALHFPRAETRTLANGMHVVVLEDHALPVVTVSVVVDQTDVFDPAGKEGLSGITSGMLNEGTTSRSADQIAEAKAELGSFVSAFGFTTVTASVGPSLDIMADELLHPIFPQAALERVKANTVASLQRLSQSSGYQARLAFASAVYGASHPYARHATEASLASITRDDVIAYHADHYRSENTTIVVVGDMRADKAVSELTRVFGGWQSKGGAGRPSVAAPAGAKAGTIYLYDRPGSAQSTVLVGELGPKRDAADHFAMELANTTLGGAFNSRLNLDLREAHGWTYGAQSGFEFRVVPEPSTFYASTDVATAKTDSALAAMMADISALRTTRPVTDTEVTFAKRAATLSMPLQFETVEQIAQATAGLVRAHLPLDYYDHVVERFEKVSPAEVEQAAKADFDTSRMAIVVVGDRAVIEAGLRGTHLGQVVVVNPTGSANR